MEAERGIWVAFEGPDGAGKSLLAERLAESLSANLVPSPSDSIVGAFARATLAVSVKDLPVEARQLIFLSDVISTYFLQIVPTLVKGQDVVSDRWVYSTLVYHHELMALMGADEDGKQTSGLMQEFHHTMTAGFGPDITFFVDTPEPVRIQRLAERGAEDLHEKVTEFQRAVASRFRTLAANTGLYEEGLTQSFSVSGHRNADLTVRQCQREISRMRGNLPTFRAYPGLYARLEQGDV